MFIDSIEVSIMRRYFAIPYHSDSVSSPSVNLYIYLKNHILTGESKVRLPIFMKGPNL